MTLKSLARLLDDADTRLPFPKFFELVFTVSMLCSSPSKDDRDLSEASSPRDSSPFNALSLLLRPSFPEIILGLPRGMEPDLTFFVVDLSWL